MPRIACIIPVLDAVAAMEPTLLSVLENRPADCEIFLIFNQPYADPYSLSEEVHILYDATAKTIIDCLNLAMPQVQSPYLNVLLPGMQVTAGWAEHAIVHFSDPRVAAIAPAICAVDDTEQVLAAGWGYDSVVGPAMLSAADLAQPEQERHNSLAINSAADDALPEITGPLYQAGFYRTMAIELLGGKFPQEVGPHWSAVDLGLSLQAVGYTARYASQSRVIALDEQILPTEQSGFRHGLYTERLYLPT